MSERLDNIEICLAQQERMLDDLSGEVARLSRLVEVLENHIERLTAAHAETLVKPQSEETPPPHY